MIQWDSPQSLVDDGQAAGDAFDLRVCGEGRSIGEEQTVFRRGELGRAETETERGTGEYAVARGNDGGETHKP